MILLEADEKALRQQIQASDDAISEAVQSNEAPLLFQLVLCFDLFRVFVAGKGLVSFWEQWDFAPVKVGRLFESRWRSSGPWTWWVCQPVGRLVRMPSDDWLGLARTEAGFPSCL